MSSETNAFQLEGLTKTYRIGVGRARVREALPPPVDRLVARTFPNWWSRDTFDALHDVTFSASPGSSVAIVGHNGAGKTTMLKLIAGVTAPTRGSVQVTGRIAALIDVLVGFHPDLTGRENVYLLGAIQGYSRKEMRSRVARIMDFAEIEDLADTPAQAVLGRDGHTDRVRDDRSARRRRPVGRRGPRGRRCRVPAQVRAMARGIPRGWRHARLRLAQPRTRSQHDERGDLARPRSRGRDGPDAGDPGGLRHRDGATRRGRADAGQGRRPVGCSPPGGCSAGAPAAHG